MLRTVKRLVGPMLGFTAHDLYVLRSMRHFWWLYSRVFPFRTSIPLRRLDHLAPQAVSGEDIYLCERVIDAYHAASAANGIECNPGPMWRNNFETQYAGLRTILKTRDAAKLAAALSTMFSSSFVHGIDTGDLYSGRNWKTYSRKILDDLASLGEQLGVVPAESGMAITGQAFAQGAETLARDVEEAFGCSLSMSRVGAPYGMVLGNVFITLQSCEYAYVAWRLAQAVRFMDRLSILELGAGYGGTALFIERLFGQRLETYTIADFPIVNVLQGYFLGKTYGGESVALFGETTPAKFLIVPGTMINGFKAVDVLFNQNSMPEMLPEVCASYLGWARDNAAMFFSYNHETVTPDKIGAVTTVPEMMSKIGGFKRASRNYSWLRPGYVEEIYERA